MWLQIVECIHMLPPSLARSRRLGDLLALLKSHFKVTASSDAVASVLLWLDIVAINQHPYQDKGCLLNDDVANLAKVCVALAPLSLLNQVPLYFMQILYELDQPLPY